MAMAYRYTQDWEWARDITQETWIKVHRALIRFDPQRPFVPWLHAIHRNGCLDHVRRSWVRLETTPGDQVLSELSGADESGPELELERRELRERILAASQELSDTQKEVFLRVDLEQEDQREVARALGMRFGTLRTTLHHARRRIGALMKGMEEST
jgi:RNA polymerase sigma-70 factor (ECF subfamily)